MNKKIRTIFAGTPDFAVPSLQAILNDDRFEVLAVITQEDKKIGRKQVLTPPPIKETAIQHNIPVWQPKKIKDILNDIANINPDVVVVVAYGKIFRQSALDIPKYGFINVHGSILPKYRGAAVIQAPIINGDQETGISIMKMDAGLDTGPILNIAKTPLTNQDTVQTVHNKLSKLGAEILPQTIIDYISGKITPQPQIGESSYAPILKKEDGKIDWNKKAEEIERLSRALSPWPGTHTQLPASATATARQANYQSTIHQPAERIIKILEIENKILDINKYKIGEVFLDNGKLAVQCGKGAIVINKLQEEGKKPMDAKDFLNGHPDFIGKVFE